MNIRLSCGFLLVFHAIGGSTPRSVSMRALAIVASAFLSTGYAQIPTAIAANDNSASPSPAPSRQNTDAAQVLRLDPDTKAAIEALKEYLKDGPAIRLDPDSRNAIETLNDYLKAKQKHTDSQFLAAVASTVSAASAFAALLLNMKISSKSQEVARENLRQSRKIAEDAQEAAGENLKRMRAQNRIQQQRSLLDSLRSQFDTLWNLDRVPIAQASPSPGAFEKLQAAAEERDDNKELIRIIVAWKECEKKYREMIEEEVAAAGGRK